LCATPALRSDVADLVGRLAHLGMLNSRMNDFFDVWFVAGTFSFDAGVLTTRLPPHFSVTGSAPKVGPFNALIGEFMHTQ